MAAPDLERRHCADAGAGHSQPACSDTMTAQSALPRAVSFPRRLLPHAGTVSASARAIGPHAHSGIGGARRAPRSVRLHRRRTAVSSAVERRTEGRGLRHGAPVSTGWGRGSGRRSSSAWARHTPRCGGHHRLTSHGHGASGHNGRQLGFLVGEKRRNGSELAAGCVPVNHEVSRRTCTRVV